MFSTISTKSGTHFRGWKTCEFRWSESTFFRDREIVPASPAKFWRNAPRRRATPFSRCTFAHLKSGVSGIIPQRTFGYPFPFENLRSQFRTGSPGKLNALLKPNYTPNIMQYFVFTSFLKKILCIKNRI